MRHRRKTGSQRIKHFLMENNETIGFFKVVSDMGGRFSFPAPGVIIGSSQRNHPGYGVFVQEFLDPLMGPVRIQAVKNLRLKSDSLKWGIVTGVKKGNSVSAASQALPQTFCQNAVSAGERECIWGG
jgi:hypothetical protein